jgi:hypothetical protein
MTQLVRLKKRLLQIFWHVVTKSEAQLKLEMR